MTRTHTLAATMFAIAALPIGSASAATWLGTTSSDWTVDANWSSPATAPPTGGTYSTRINVNNGSNNALYYTSTQGTTIFNASDGALRSSSASGGSMFITGGTFDSRGAAQDFIGRNGTGTNTLTIAGGTYTNVNGGSTELLLLYGGGSTGIINVNSGSLIAGNIRAGFNSSQSGTGTINLNGGLLSTGNIAEVSGGPAGLVTTINFNGGTLQARTTHTAFINTNIDNAVVLAGGAVIDSNGFNITIPKALTAGAGNGGLTKQGGGALTLSAVNTYTGNTTVTAGSLVLANTGELLFNIANGGVSNSILGSGAATLDGLFRLDITALTDTAGTWNLVNTATKSFGGTFNLAFTDDTAFTNAGGGLYTSGDWSFDTATGNLTLIPEPASLALAGMGLLMMLPRRRR
jgi:autotransporter-associated beta strand protein